MQAVVYSTDGCPRCDALKSKLKEAGIMVEERDPNWLINPAVNTDWRVNGSTSRMAYLVLQGWDLSSVPVLEADGKIYDMSKRSQVTLFGKVIALDQQSECKDGVCTFRPRQVEQREVAVA